MILAENDPPLIEKWKQKETSRGKAAVEAAAKSGNGKSRVVRARRFSLCRSMQN
jgi:hypothetical protein